MEADRVIVELIAKVEQFDQRITQSATTFDRSMDRIQGSSGRAESAVVRTGKTVKSTADGISQASTQMKSSLVDVSGLLASSKGPFNQVIQQGPKAAAASKALTFAAASLGGIMGGAVATGVGLAVDALIDWISSGKDVNAVAAEMLQKLRENAKQAEAAARASALYANSLEGVTEAMRAQEGALKALTDAGQGQARQLTVQIGLSNVRLERLQDETQALIDKARAEVEANRAAAAGSAGQGTGGAAGSFIAGEADKSIARLDELEKRLGTINQRLDKSRANFREAFSLAVVERAEKLADPLQAIKEKYEGPRGLIEQTRKLATAEQVRNGTLAQQVQLLKQKQKAEEDAARAAQKGSKSSGLPPVTGEEIARALGTTITSGQRSAERNKAVGGAANSYHLSGQAIDIPLTVNGKPLTKAGIRDALAPLGVQIKELLGPGDKGHDDHFHIAFSKKRLGPDQVAANEERAAREAERIAQEIAQRDYQLAAQRERLQQQEIDARQALTTSAEELARLEKESIDAARQKYDETLDQLAAEKTVTAEQLKQIDELRKINAANADLRKELVDRRLAEQQARLAIDASQRQTNVAAAQLDAQQSLLQSQEALAKSSSERRDLESRIIDLQFREEELRLEAIISQARIAEALARQADNQEAIDEAVARQAEAQASLSTLGQRRDNAQQGNAEQNASPLQAYFNDIPSTAAEINDALESLAAGGLESVSTGLAQAIMGFRSFGDVGRQVVSELLAGLIKLGIQQLLLHTIGASLGTAAVGTAAAQAAVAGAAWAPAAALASLATLGANAGPAAAALTATTALATALAIPKLAKGGRVSGPGGPVGDRIPAMLSDGEFVVRSAAARNLGYDTLQAINNTGALPMTAPRITNARAAAPGGGGGFSDKDLGALRGIVSEAINAMPDVALYPTIDPVDVLTRALATKRGSQALVVAIGRNRGDVNGRLQ